MMMKKKNLAKAVTLSVLLMLPYGMAQAQTYTDTIQGGNDKYADEGIRTGNETDGFVYNFQDGDNLNITNPEKGSYTGIYKLWTQQEGSPYNGKFTINGKLNINVTQNLNDNIFMGYGIRGGSYATGDIILQNGANIIVTMDKGYDNGTVRAVGVLNTANTDYLGDSNIYVNAKNENNQAVAVGLQIGDEGTIVYGNGEIVASAEGATTQVWGIMAEGSSTGNIELGNIKINATANAKDEEIENDNYAIGITNHADGASIIGGDIVIEATATSNTEYNGYYTYARGISLENDDNQIEFDKVNITSRAINTNQEGQDIISNGIFNYGDNSVCIKGDTVINASIEAVNNLAYVNGIYNEFGNVTIGDGSITAKIENGTDEYAANFVYAVRAYGGSETNLGNMNISAISDGGADVVNVTAILADDSTINMAGGSINVKAENYTEDASCAVTAILSENGATVNINKGTSNDVVITGDIQADADAAIVLNLNTKDSVLNGSVQDLLVTEGGNGEGIKMTVANGAVWNPDNYSDVSNLTVANGGVVDTALMYDTVTSDPFDNLKFTNLDGEGGIFKLNVDGSANEDNSTRVYVEGVHSGSHIIDINEIGDDMDNAKGTVLVSVKDEQGTFTAQDKEGSLYWTKYELAKETENVTDGYTADWILDEIKQDDTTQTSSVAAIMGANALNYHTWRAENDQLMRRMGELRNNGADEEGAWFRVHGSKISRDDNAAFENEYTTYELGYDQITKQTDDMTRYTGAALSYTDGSSGYDSGIGENHSKAIAFYNTDIYNSGHYLDLVFKYANMDNDFNVYDTNNNKIRGEYKNTGISISAEYGRKNELKHGWYVEPQAQLTLGYFGGDEYETSNGISVDQSGIASVLGRVGFNIGKQIGDSGVIYAKANLLHEFAGDYDIDMTDSTGISRSESESFNDTWFEYGVGVALKTGKNNHLYFDFVKTAGGDFEKDWQWNAGMRWTF